MRPYFFICSLFFTTAAQAQLLSGALLDEGRKLITATNFTLDESHEGVIIFNVAVDRTGKVASAKVDPIGTTVISTPARIVATNYVKTFQFQEGTYFPEFHQVKVKLTLKSALPPKEN